MKLTVRDAARILSVSEKSIYRWIKDGVIPAYQINDQYRFNRAELLEWATSRRINVSPEIFAEPEGGETPPLGASALAIAATNTARSIPYCFNTAFTSLAETAWPLLAWWKSASSCGAAPKIPVRSSRIAAAVMIAPPAS